MVGLPCGSFVCGEGKYNFDFTLYKILNSAKTAYVTLYHEIFEGNGGKLALFKAL